MSVIKKSRFRLCCSSHPDVNNGIVRCKQRRLTYTTPPRKGIGCNETHFIQWRCGWRALKNRVVFLCSPPLLITRRGWKRKEKKIMESKLRPMLEVEPLSKWGDSKDNDTLFNDYYLFIFNRKYPCQGSFSRGSRQRRIHYHPAPYFAGPLSLLQRPID